MRLTEALPQRDSMPPARLSVKTGDRKIATFNVNGINGRLPVLLRWLAEAKPDVVCLQELKAPDEKFPEPAIREAGYRAVWHGQKSWNGVSVDREVRGWEKASLWRRRQPMPSTQGLCVGHPNGAFGLDRCMWGTGWTLAVALLTYEQGVEAFRVTDRFSDSERAVLMGETLQRVYNWSS